MATFNVEIDLGNSAFEDSSEVARILRNLADRVEIQVIAEEVTHNGGDYPLKDINGNRVGSAWIQEDLAMGHTAENDALADALERHNTLGARCTCGAALPPNRLDTPRWFAEHLADVVRSIIPPDEPGCAYYPSCSRRCNPTCVIPPDKTI